MTSKNWASAAPLAPFERCDAASGPPGAAPAGLPRGAVSTGQASRRTWLASAAGCAVSLSGLGGLGGCASLGGHDAAGAGTGAVPPPADASSATAALDAPPAPHVLPFSTTALGGSPAGWRPYAVRRDLKPTRYAVVRDGERHVLHARAAASATGLRCAVHIDPAATGHLQFSWRVRDVPQRADVAAAEHDDCPARLILAVGGDDTRLPLRDRLFFEQVELFTGQRLPYATLMYVWDGGRHAVESVHRNHRSNRIQYLTVESGAQRAGRWLHYERDVVADYQRVFGEAPGPIISVGVLTDADALKTNLEAWYGDITLGLRPAATLAATG